MCGIRAGFASTSEIIDGLKKLQYRGSDCWGIGSYTGPNSDKQNIHKHIGKEFNNILDGFDDNPILGHNRWASESEVSIGNCHPILGHHGNILLVHNGSLTNYHQIAKWLEKKLKINYFDEDSSDTVVLTDFIDYCLYLQGTELSQFKKKIDDYFEGTYAVVFAMKGNKGLFFLIQDSPLYYYEGQLSSDPSIFPLYFPLQNNSYGSVSKKGGNFELRINGLIVQPEYLTNESWQSGDKQEVIGSLMLSEIKEQAKLSYDYLPYGRLFEEKMRGLLSGDIELVGCGSSYNAALLGKKYFDLTGNFVNVSVHYASEYTPKYPWRESLKIAISQSGETADTLEVMRGWRDSKYLTPFLITNRPESTGTRLAHHIFPLNLKNEEAVAATKSFTGMALMLLALGNWRAYSDINWKAFKEGIEGCISNADTIAGIAKEFSGFNQFLVTGTGLNYPIAREISLKLKEVSQIHAEAEPSGQIKHGCLSIVDPKTLTIFLLPSKIDRKYERILNNAKQIQARGGKLLGIGPIKETLFDYFIQTPKINNILLEPLLNNVNGQLLSYELALEKGIDPDHCRSLAKAITVY